MSASLLFNHFGPFLYEMKDGSLEEENLLAFF